MCLYMMQLLLESGLSEQLVREQRRKMSLHQKMSYVTWLTGRWSSLLVAVTFAATNDTYTRTPFVHSRSTRTSSTYGICPSRFLQFESSSHHVHPGESIACNRQNYICIASSTTARVRMFYSSAAFIAIVAASANGFSMPKAPQRLSNLKMSDQWAPNTKTINTVSLETLK